MLKTKWLQGWVALVAVAVMGTLVLAGCGGGDDDETSSSAGAVAAKEGDEGAQGGGEGGAASAGGESGEAAGGAASAEGGASAGGQGSEAGGEAAAGGGTGKAAGKAGVGGGKAKQSARKKRSRKAAGSSDESAAVEAYFAQADAICRERRKNTRQHLGDYTKAGLENIEKNAPRIVTELIIPNLEQEMQELQALSVPAGASQATAALYAAIEKMIATGKAEPAAFLLTAGVVASAEEEAKANGFNVCGGI
jgi:hypothetical protein